MPARGRCGLLFQGGATDFSATNTDDYALTPGPAVFTTNARASATVVSCPQAFDPIVGTDLKDFALLQNCFSETPGLIATCCEAADTDGDLTVDEFDYGLLFDNLIGPRARPRMTDHI